jgi:hypothetical protein
MFDEKNFLLTAQYRSALPEAKLAREAEIAYCMVCMSTDYDCWSLSLFSLCYLYFSQKD